MKLSPRFLAVCAALLPLVPQSPAQVNITTWQVNAAHTGNNAQETSLTPGTISSPGNFGLLYTQPTDGQTYGQPLLASGVTINGAAHNVVYVATQHCSLYGFDADSNAGGNANPLWKVSLLPAGTVPVPQGVVGSGDISTELGITTTPVIDTASQTIYIVSKVQRTSDTTYHQYLYALDLATGATKFNSPVEIAASFPGSSNDSSGGQIQFNPLREHLRCAMALNNGVVYLAYASHSDTTPYHGEVLGYDATTLQLVKKFNATPNGTNPEGGIWQSGASPAFDGAGNLFLAVGNGAWDQTNSSNGTNWGESVLKMSTSGALGVAFSDTTKWFTPNNYKALNNGDLDLGSGGLLLLPDQSGPHPHIMVVGGKGAVLYVIDRDNLGGLQTPDAAIQEIPSLSGNWFFSTPAYYNGFIYYTAAGGPLEQRAVGYNPVDGSYISTTPTTSNDVVGNKGSSCFITSNGTANGIVWLLTGSGIRAYNAANVAGQPIWSGNAVVPTGNINCQTTKFSLPMVANGKVYYTAYDSSNVGHLFVYGLLPAAVGTPGAPTDAAANATSASSIAVSWTSHSTNESGFKVKRSTSPTGGFATVTTTGAGVTTFIDSNLQPSTTYYYQVVATNANGDSNATNVASAKTFPVYTETGLVAYWPMDETGGNTVKDVTVNTHDGTVNGEAGVVSALINNGVELHGTGQATSNVTVPDVSDLRFTVGQSFTLSAWVLPSALRGSEETIIAKSRNTGNYYGIWINAGNQWVFRGPSGDVISSAAPVAGSWTHLAVVQDGAANTRKIYVNGSLTGSGTAQAADGTGALWMGQQNVTGNFSSFPGTLDEVRLYNRALAASEVTNLMGAPVLEAHSNQVHGTAGTFGLTIWPLTTKAIESRKGSTAGQYSVVLNFSAPVSGITASLATQSGGAAVGSVKSVAYDTTKQVVTVTLQNVGNAQSLKVHLAGITPASGASTVGGTADIPLNVLWGDANADNVVNALDASIVQHLHAAVVDGTNALYDFNADGAVNSADDAIAAAASGTNLGAQTDTNLAYFQPTVSLSDLGNNTSDMAVDNYLNTRWESVQNVDPEWIYVDLGSVCTVHAIKLNWENAAGKNYTLDASNDANSWVPKVTVTGNTTTGAIAYNNLNFTARYVRMNGTARTTQYGYSLYDFQVIGTSGGATAAPVVNSATTASATVGSAFAYQITATNSPGSFNATGLPAGLSVATATGVISGTPTQAGSFPVAISATNGAGTGNATLTLTVQGGGFSAWQSQYFTAAEMNNPAVSGPLATPAGDGISNLMKYALGLNPKANGTGSLPAQSLTNAGGQSYLTLTYVRPLATTELTYAVEVSGDLQTWSGGGNATTTVSATNNADGKTQTVVVRDNTAASSTGKRFIHLRVTTP